MALNRVLIAVGPNDGERVEKMADTAAEIAAPAGSTVIIAHVFTEEEFSQTVDRLDFDDPAEASPDEVAQRLTTVRSIGRRLEEEGIEYRIISKIGDHADTVVSIAEDETADLVIVGGSKRSPTGKAVFGSTAQQILLESPAPVTFVRSNR